MASPASVGHSRFSFRSHMHLQHSCSKSRAWGSETEPSAGRTNSNSSSGPSPSGSSQVKERGGVPSGPAVAEEGSRVGPSERKRDESSRNERSSESFDGGVGSACQRVKTTPQVPQPGPAKLTLGVVIEELFLSFFECARDDELIHVRVGGAADRERGVDEAAARRVSCRFLTGARGLLPGDSHAFPTPLY